MLLLHQKKLLTKKSKQFTSGKIFSFAALLVISNKIIDGTDGGIFLLTKTFIGSILYEHALRYVNFLNLIESSCSGFIL